MGKDAVGSNTTGNNNIGIGTRALQLNTTAGNNVAIGFEALQANTTAANNTAIGYQALLSNTTGIQNTAIGQAALDSNTTASNNVGIGANALGLNTTGTQNTVVGTFSGDAVTTGSDNTFVGKSAGGSITTGSNNTAIGEDALLSATTPTFNTVLGSGAGRFITTGSKNTIIGGYTGNQGGLDIRTSNNYIVLSDGDGNPRAYWDNNGYMQSIGVYNNTTASAANVHVASNGYVLRSTSSLRYKNTINDATHGLTELLELRPVTYKGNNDNDGDTVFGGLIAEEVHDAGLTEFVQYNDDGEPDALAYGNMVSLCIKAIQEQQETITALEARIAALESN
jgi:hypothetical protein